MNSNYKRIKCNCGAKTGSTELEQTHPTLPSWNLNLEWAVSFMKVALVRVFQQTPKTINGVVIKKFTVSRLCRFRRPSHRPPFLPALRLLIFDPWYLRSRLTERGL